MGVDEELISVIDVAQQLGRQKGHLFKVLRRLRIEPTKRRSSTSKNQLISYITHEELQRVILEVEASPTRGEAEPSDGDAEDFVSIEFGTLYLIQLEPKYDPGRFKVGFAANMPERLRQLWCSAPFATVIQTWPCRRLWERTAIDSVSAGCDRLHTEVFRSGSLGDVVERCVQFFAVMPLV